MLRLNRNFRTKYVNETGILIQRAQYDDGSTALLLKTAYGEPLAHPTVSVVASGETPSEGNDFIKDYAENKGMWKALHDAGVVGNVVRIIELGSDADVYECPLLAKDFN